MGPCGLHAAIDIRPLTQLSMSSDRGLLLRFYSIASKKDDQSQLAKTLIVYSASVLASSVIDYKGSH
jgi:hypothetical protein